MEERPVKEIGFDESGLKDKYKKEEKLSVAKKMLKKGFSIEDIMDTTELSREEVLELKEKQQ